MSQVFKILRSGPFADFPLYGELFDIKGKTILDHSTNEACLLCEDTIPFEIAKEFSIKTTLLDEDDFNNPEILSWYKERMEEKSIIIIYMVTFSISVNELDVETDFLRIDPADIPALHTEWIKQKV